MAIPYLYSTNPALFRETPVCGRAGGCGEATIPDVEDLTPRKIPQNYSSACITCTKYDLTDAFIQHFIFNGTILKIHEAAVKIVIQFLRDDASTCSFSSSEIEGTPDDDEVIIRVFRDATDRKNFACDLEEKVGRVLPGWRISLTTINTDYTTPEGLDSVCSKGHISHYQLSRIGDFQIHIRRKYQSE